MSDSYQAIYDAVRSRITGGDIGSAISEVARQALDISYALPGISQDISIAAQRCEEAITRPSAVYRPQIFMDGKHWCALYGKDLQEGVAGFGASPAEAMDAFDVAWNEKLP